ncbi:MAG: glycosyltransferase [Alphaproteobacteria bacterium]|nr:glycosyltransferase [Alphaproteobacteria bacterium]
MTTLVTDGTGILGSKRVETEGGETRETPLARPATPEAAIAGDRPLRILIPSYRSDPYTGGQGVYLRHLTKALSDQGHSVDVISGPPYPVLDPRVGLIKLPSLDLYSKPKNWLGVPDYPRDEIRDEIDRGEYWTHVSGGFGEPWSFGERMAKWAPAHRSDYDVVHDNQTLCYGLLKLRALGMPVVGTIHHPISMDRRIAIAHAGSFKLRLLMRRWYSFLGMQKKVARALDIITTASENTKKDTAVDFGVDPAKMHVVHLGIDVAQFRPIPAIARRPNRLMATASADVPLKGLIYLVRAYAELLQRYPDLELTVVGRLREGPTENLLRQLGIRDRVNFVSGLTDEEIAERYAEATIAVAPSVYEGFGFPPGEAMACGVPVVATAGGSLPEIVGDAGIVTPVRDASALAAGIASLLENPEKRAELGAKGRARVLDKFQWTRTAAGVVRVYRQAIADAHARS